MKTRKVFYSTKITDRYVIGGFTLECITVCNVNDDAYVGGIACHGCKYFVSDNYDEAKFCGVVECKGVEDRRGSSPAVGFPNKKH